MRSAWNGKVDSCAFEGSENEPAKKLQNLNFRKMGFCPLRHDAQLFVPTPIWDDGQQDQMVPAPQPVRFPQAAAQRSYHADVQLASPHA